MSETSAAGSPVTYIPGFVENHAQWFERLSADLQWERRPDAPRSEYWANVFDRPYTYGRGMGERTYAARPTHELIEAGRAMLQSEHGVVLEGCFLNLYGTKRDWLGWHADDDKGIDHGKPIAVITLGQGRIIEYREVMLRPQPGLKGVYGPTVGQMLEPGSLFLMHAGMQSMFEHRIPKASFEAKPRISMTYRGLVA